MSANSSLRVPFGGPVAGCMEEWMNWAIFVPERSTVRARLTTRLTGLTCFSTPESGEATPPRAGADGSAGAAEEEKGVEPLEDLVEAPAGGGAAARELLVEVRRTAGAVVLLSVSPLLRGAPELGARRAPGSGGPGHGSREAKRRRRGPPQSPPPSAGSLRAPALPARRGVVLVQLALARTSLRPQGLQVLQIRSP